MGRHPSSGRGPFDPNLTKLQDEYFNVTTGWFVPVHFMVPRLGDIEIFMC